MKICGSPKKICGSQRKSGVSNEFIWVPYESLGSATKIWGLNEKLGVSNVNLGGVSNEKLGLSNEMVEMDDHYP